MKIFDYLNGMTSEKKELNFDLDEVSKGYDSYMTNRWVSMCELYLPIAAEINRINTSDEDNYNYYRISLPKNHVYFSYIKKNKSESLKEKEYLAKFYKVNLKETDELLKILKPEQIKKIVEFYERGGKVK